MEQYQVAERDLPIINKLGLHARAASRFVQTAAQFDADIRVHKDGRDVCGKSIMGIMMLAAARGSHIRVCAEGADANTALDALEALVADRFGEQE